MPEITWIRIRKVSAAGLFILFLVSGTNRLFGAGISGIFDICSSCTYSSLSAAAADLNTKGVSGPVTFRIHAGVFKEAVSFKNITGTSSANTVTFIGAGTDSTILKASSSFLLNLSNVSYLAFRNMALSTDSSGETVTISNASHITIDHCHIMATVYLSKASLKAYGLSAQDVDHCIFNNNRFEGGINGLVNYGLLKGGNNNVSNNRFIKFYTAGITASASGQSGNIYSNNIFDSSVYASGATCGISIYYENGVVVSDNECINCGVNVFNLNNASEKDISIIGNNFVRSNAKLGALMYVTFLKGNILIAHNTLYASPNTAPDYGFYANATSNSKGIRIMNNIFDIEKPCTHSNINIDGLPGNFAAIDGNNYYTGAGRLDSVSFFGRKYSSYSRLYADAVNLGFEVYSSNMKPAFKSSTNLHLDTTKANATGIYAGIDTDIDGDIRCRIAPSAGADESRFGKYAKPTLGISGPDTVFDRSPSLFTDTSAKSKMHSHHWYVNGIDAGDSLALRTALPKYPSVTISLVTTGCGGVDSISRIFSVAYPSKAPATDFAADYDTVRKRGLVHFIDLSANAPTHWQWQVSQDSDVAHGTRRPSFRYVNSTDTSQNPVVQFLAPGSYRVCLTTSNVLKNGTVGQGGTICREHYIYVSSFSPVLKVSGPDTTFIAVNTSSGSFATIPGILEAVDSTNTPVQDTLYPAHVPVNTVDTVKITYLAYDDNGDTTITYRWVIVYDSIAPVLSLRGKDTEVVEVQTAYRDLGVFTSDNYYSSQLLDSLVKSHTDLNVDRVGIYTIVYTLKDPSGNAAVPVVRNIIVKDTMRPIIKLNGSEPDSVEVNTQYEDTGVAVSDNYDHNMAIVHSGSFYTQFPSGFATRLGTYIITYSVADSSGNRASVSRTVVVFDSIAPVVKLNGPLSDTVCRWSKYKDAGYTATDNYYKFLKTDTLGTFRNTNLPGLYKLQYRATDSSGNTGFSANRLIYVLPEGDKACKSETDELATLQNHVSIFPNPTTGVIYVTADLPGKELFSIRISNITGAVVYELKEADLSQGAFSANLEKMPAGVYILNIAARHNILTRRIILVK